MLDQNTIRAGFVRFEVWHWFRIRNTTEMTGFDMGNVCAFVV